MSRRLFSDAAWTLAGAILLVALMVSFPGLGRAEAPAVGGLSQAEMIRLGERMYREGILPSGEVMPAFIRGDVEVDSSAFSCSSCHQRAGLGSYEGGVVTPPTTGVRLYQPYRRPPSMNDTLQQSGRFIYARTLQERQAYNRETLAAALRLGVDPTGQPFNDVMPRYPLSPRDMAILIGYLEWLSSKPSPGASRSLIRFATVITDEVSRDDREALLVPLRSFIDQKNQQASLYQDFLKFGYSPTIEMKDAFSNASLDIWELKGPPGTWRAQLDAYYAEKPVFAVLGGISYGDWRPIHEFCEAQRLPCLFPITDFPVVSESGWYTYYFNRGYEQEGETVARYLNRNEKAPSATPVLELVQDSPGGRALARGFQRAWSELGRPAPKSVTLSEADLGDPARLGRLVEQYRPGALVIWSDQRVYPALGDIAGRLPAASGIFLSSSLLGKEAGRVPEKLRGRIYLSFPYRLDPYLGTRDANFDAKVPTLASARDFGSRRITSRVSAMLTQVALRGINLLYDNLYRDYLMDVLSMQMDQTVLDYERFSFGPGQRYVSKGCYIIQLGPGSDPALLPKSGWVVH